MAYAFLVTYQAYYLLAEVGSREADVPRQVYLGTVVQSVCPGRRRAARRPPVRPCGAPEGRSSWRRPSSTQRALVIVAARAASSGYLVGMAVGGAGFGMYMAVDLALVVDVLTDPLNAAKDLGVLNIAGALPFALDLNAFAASGLGRKHRFDLTICRYVFPA